jgi:putative restriction endonuclease
MARGRLWSSDELILALDLYCRTPFGRLHRTNPEIVILANALGRSPSSVAMKCCNYASLDPDERARGIRGLKGTSEADREVFARFANDLARLDLAKQEAFAALKIPPSAAAPDSFDKTHDDVATRLLATQSATEGKRLQRVRRLQSLFRQVVLVSYEHACAVCNLARTELLDAAHITPWSDDQSARLNPANGVAFCVLHHRAFDQGLMTVDDDQRVVFAKSLLRPVPCDVHRAALIEPHGRTLRLPRRFRPPGSAFTVHRTTVFRDS